MQGKPWACGVGEGLLGHHQDGEGVMGSPKQAAGGLRGQAVPETWGNVNVGVGEGQLDPLHSTTYTPDRVLWGGGR